MIKAIFGLSETGSVRQANEDSYLLDRKSGLFAVADGLGGLPNGSQASRLTLDLLKHKITRNPEAATLDLISEVNMETRKAGFNLDAAGFGTTLTLARCLENGESVEITHVGDSAAYRVRDGACERLTVEHTVAARILAGEFDQADEAIPLAAHHTLTQCIGQEPFIDPQLVTYKVRPGDRLFLFTDGVTKAVAEPQLRETLVSTDSLEKVSQTITFLVEVAGSPDNYTLVAIQF